MTLDPWCKVGTARREVWEGRSFSPDEFAIALEQMVAGTASPDYREQAPFFSCTCFTGALTEHSGMALRRLAGRTEYTVPVLTLITQFGGGKTHTLTALYHLARAGTQAAGLPGCRTCWPQRAFPNHPAQRSTSLWAMRGIPRKDGKLPGSTWHGNWPEREASPYSALPPEPRHPAPRRWRRCSLMLRIRCCCCSR